MRPKREIAWCESGSRLGRLLVAWEAFLELRMDAASLSVINTYRTQWHRQVTVVR
jgi:hypothetical protein